MQHCLSADAHFSSDGVEAHLGRTVGPQQGVRGIEDSGAGLGAGVGGAWGSTGRHQAPYCPTGGLASGAPRQGTPPVRYGPTMKPNLHSLSLLCVALTWGGCSDESAPKTGTPGTSGGDSATVPAPTFAECQQWMAEVPHDGGATRCESANARDVEQVISDGARVITLSSGRTALAWLPEDWETRDAQSLLVLVHGSAGCAEGTFGDFRRLIESDHALLSLQYQNADGSYARGDAVHDDLTEAMQALRSACPVANAKAAVYGLSRGAARTVQLAGQDRAGPQRFTAFVVDSGTLPTSDYNGRSLEGARFWMWCGEHDPDPQRPDQSTCGVMAADMVPTIEGLGGTVDAFIQGEDSCHGVFKWDCDATCSTCAGSAHPTDLGPHLTALREYLNQTLKD